MSEVKSGIYRVPNGYDVGDCYSQDTQVLTEKGWMFHDEWNGERIAMFDLESGETLFDYPEKLNTYDYEGVMHHYNSKMIDTLVTPNHKMVVKPNWKGVDEPWRLVESSELSRAGFKMVSSSTCSGGITSSFVDGYNDVDLAELCGYYTSEGTYTSNSFSFSQAPGDVLDKMIACLERMGVSYNKRVKKDRRGYLDSVCIRVYKNESPDLVDWVLKNCGVYSYGVKVPTVFYTAPIDVRTAYLDAHLDGDGCRSKNNYSVNTTSKHLCDGLQAIATSLGYRTSHSVKESKKKNHRTMYIVYMNQEAKDFHFDIKRYRREVMYEGKIYCFTTKTGAYVTRRNGKVSFHGNSSHFYNLPDNGITVYRNLETRQTEVHRWKVRFKYTGQLGVNFYHFNVKNSLYEPTEKLNDGSDKTKFVLQPEAAKNFASLSL
jgi:hypothetical protein